MAIYITRYTCKITIYIMVRKIKDIMKKLQRTVTQNNYLCHIPVCGIMYLFTYFQIFYLKPYKYVLYSL